MASPVSGGITKFQLQLENLSKEHGFVIVVAQIALKRFCQEEVSGRPILKFLAKT